MSSTSPRSASLRWWLPILVVFVGLGFSPEASANERVDLSEFIEPHTAKRPAKTAPAKSAVSKNKGKAVSKKKQKAASRAKAKKSARSKRRR